SSHTAADTAYSVQWVGTFQRRLLAGGVELRLGIARHHIDIRDSGKLHGACHAGKQGQTQHAHGSEKSRFPDHGGPVEIGHCTMFPAETKASASPVGKSVSSRGLRQILAPAPVSEPQRRRTG